MSQFHTKTRRHNVTPMICFVDLVALWENIFKLIRYQLMTYNLKLITYNLSTVVHHEGVIGKRIIDKGGMYIKYFLDQFFSEYLFGSAICGNFTFFQEK